MATFRKKIRLFALVVHICSLCLLVVLAIDSTSQVFAPKSSGFTVPHGKVLKIGSRAGYVIAFQYVNDSSRYDGYILQYQADLDSRGRTVSYSGPFDLDGGISAGGRYWVIVISYRIAVVLSLLMMTVCGFEIQRLGRKLVRKKKENLCSRCSYDLRVHLAGGAGPNCPECGKPIQRIAGSKEP